MKNEKPDSGKNCRCCNRSLENTNPNNKKDGFCRPCSDYIFEAVTEALASSEQEIKELDKENKECWEIITDKVTCCDKEKSKMRKQLAEKDKEIQDKQDHITLLIDKIDGLEKEIERLKKENQCLDARASIQMHPDDVVQQALSELRDEIEGMHVATDDEHKRFATFLVKNVLKAIDSKIPFFQSERAKNGLLTPKKCINCQSKPDYCSSCPDKPGLSWGLKQKYQRLKEGSDSRRTA
jgi:DNA repair exonuclease SbcCD ATPase subunit